MYEIKVSRVAEERLLMRFHVRVAEADGSSTEHDVTLLRADQENLGGRYPTSEAFIRACFEFLLDREPKGSILSSFDVRQISTYFPEFEKAMLQPENSGPRG